MPTYRKIGEVVEARRVPVYEEYSDITTYLADAIALAEWCGGTSHLMNEPGEYGAPHLLVPTASGEAWVWPGDYVSRSEDGAWDVHGKATFEACYEAVGDAR